LPPTPTLLPYTTLFRSQQLLLTLRQLPAFGQRNTGVARREPLASDQLVDRTLGESRRVLSVESLDDHGAGEPPLRMLAAGLPLRSEEHTSELQSRENLV